MQPVVIAVDLGGTQIRAARIDAGGTLLSRAAHPTPSAEGPQAVVQGIVDAVIEAMEGMALEGISAIGIGAPGPVDAETGALIDPPNIPGWGTRSLSEALARHFPCRTYVGNDANVAALGERRFGAGVGVNDMVYLTVSTGIGGGVISGGRLVTGWRGFAGEIGHQVLVPDGPLCGCGQRGHLEALAAGPSIAREVRAQLETGAESAILTMVSSPAMVTAEIIGRAAAAGDPLAREAFERAAYYIGLGLVNVIHILEPERILIGGGVSKAGDLLFDPIRRTVQEHVLSEIYQDVDILPAALAEDVGLLGAAALALESLDPT